MILQKGRYRARQGTGADDIDAAQALRALAFGCDDRDAFDDVCLHVLVEDVSTQQLLCCFRMQLLRGEDLQKSYSAQFYDLSALARYEGVMVEMGRFCTDPAYAVDHDLLRVAWGAMTAFVDAHQVTLLFGCSSFTGTDSVHYADCFGLLKDRYLAPVEYQPKIRSPDVFRFEHGACDTYSRAEGLRAMPPLLRTYLMMGGWVSDHAVIDRQMNTLHVFTGVEIANIPDARKRLLRAVVG